MRPCSVCFNLTETEVCEICDDSNRDHRVVCIVEQPRDQMALEAAGVYRGVYHILQGAHRSFGTCWSLKILRSMRLVDRVRRDGVTEIVMATNPTLEGDGTALYISNVLEGTGVKITRLARGIASGSVLEFANREMLADAMRGRQSF